MNINHELRTLVAGLQLAALTIFIGQSYAGNTWDGGGGDNNWGTANNWSPDGTPGVGSTSDLFFGGTTRLASFNNYGAFDDFRNLTFNSGAGAFTITGSSIDFFGKIENLSSNTQTLSITSFSMNSAAGSELNPVNGNLNISSNIFNNTNEVKVWGNNGFTLTLSGQVQGAGAFSVNQNSNVVFAASQLYSGQTKIDAGSIRVDVVPSGLGLTSTYFVGNGGATGTAAALNLGNTSGGLTFGNPVSVNLGSGGNRIVGGTNTSGTNAYSGTVTLNDSNATLRAATGGTVSFNTISAAALQTIAVGGGGNNGTVQLGGISDNINVSATVNSGTLVLGKNSSASVHSVGGTLAINSGGTAQLGGTGGDQIFNSGSIAVSSGGAFDMNDRSETVTNVSLAGTGISSSGALVNNGISTSTLTATGTTTLTADSSIGVTNSAGTINLSGNITGSFGLTKVGAGTLTVTGTNSYTTTTVSAGTVQIGNGGTTGTLGSGAVTTNGILAINRSDNITVANDISGTGSITQNGAGTTILTGTNTYGATTISSGTLQIGSAGATGSLGSGSVTNNSALVLNRSGNILLTNAISGSGSLTQNGSNIVSISSANSYTGATTINSGTIRVTANEALGTAAVGTTVNSGGALRLSGVNYTTAEALNINGTGVGGTGALYNIGGDSTYAGAITAATHATIGVAGGSLTLTGGLVKNGTTLTIAGNGRVNINTVGISGASANSDLIVNGATVVTTVASTYNGPTTVENAGTLVANNTTGSATGTGSVTVSIDSTLSGTGAVNAGVGNFVTINGTLQVGDSTLGSPVASSFTLNSGGGSTVLGSTSSLRFDLFSRGGDLSGTSTAADYIRLFGAMDATAGGTLMIASNGLSGFAYGDKWKLFDLSGPGSITGTLGLDYSSLALGPALSASFDSGTGILSVVPEPSRMVLFFMGALGILLPRRRR